MHARRFGPVAKIFEKLIKEMSNYIVIGNMDVGPVINLVKLTWDKIWLIYVYDIVAYT